MWRVAGFLALVAIGACGSEGRAPVMILDALGEPGRTDIALFPASCNQSPEAEVIAENDNTVTVEVKALAGNGDDCGDSVIICLDEPLGDRVLVDATTDMTVPMQGLEGSSNPCVDASDD